MNYFLTALLLTWIIPLLGLCLNCVITIVYRVFCKIVTPVVGFALFNYVTFIGVVHHELSHALLAFITGAKITKITLFKPQEFSLGSVEMIYRGNKLTQSIQATFSAMAPIFCGCISLYLLYFKVICAYTLTIGWQILIYYIFVSILLHMTMSLADFKCFWKGSFGLTFLLFLLCYVLKIDLMLLI